MELNVQCIYGNDNIDTIEQCIIKNIHKATSYDINFVCMNYEKNGYKIESGNRYGINVLNIIKKNEEPTGFAQNHNYLFSNCKKTEFFVLLNPDCIPLDNCIEKLIDTKRAIGDKCAIVEGKQWPFEHPKEFNLLTHETPWASGAFELIDSRFYEQVHGMDELYFLYDEDVDLSWQAWLHGYSVIYEPTAQIIHFTSGNFSHIDKHSIESYYSLRNFILISKKFFGDKGEKNAICLLKDTIDKRLFEKIVDDYNSNIKNKISSEFVNKHHKNIKILGINSFAELRK